MSRLPKKETVDMTRFPNMKSKLTKEPVTPIAGAIVAPEPLRSDRRLGLRDSRELLPCWLA